MRLKPVGWKVYLRMDDAKTGLEVSKELATMGFEIRRGMDEHEIRRSIASEDIGTIVAIGPLAWRRQDLQGIREQSQWENWVEVGDRVVFGRHAGKLIREPTSGEWLMLVNDEDIQSIILPEDTESLAERVEAEIEHQENNNLEER